MDALDARDVMRAVVVGDERAESRREPERAAARSRASAASRERIATDERGRDVAGAPARDRRRTRRATDRARPRRARPAGQLSRRRARGRSRSSRSRAARDGVASRRRACSRARARNCLGGVEWIGGEPARRRAGGVESTSERPRPINVARRLGGDERPARRARRRRAPSAATRGRAAPASLAAALER